MYSVILAAALTTTPAPAFGGGLFHRDRGCTGGCASYSAGCQGCGGGCQGCNGCCGGGYGFLGVRDYFADLFGSRGCQGCNGGCGGCQGGCYGGGGCTGWSGGCYGGMPAGYSTSCYGGMPMSFDSGYSMGCGGGYPMSSGYPVVSGVSSYGFSGMGYSMGSMPYGQMPMTQMPFEQAPMMGSMPYGQMPMTQAPMMQAPSFDGQYAVPPATMPQAPANTMPQAYDSTTPPNQATIVVTLPADARMFVEDQSMTLTGSVRTFRTPTLNAGRFNYVIRIEVERNGRTERETKTVEVEPGKVARVHFAEPATGGSVRAALTSASQ